VMGVTHLVANAIDERPSFFVIARGVGLAAGVAVAYFTLQLGFEHLMAGTLLPKGSVRGPLDLAIVALVVVMFGAVTVLQNTMPYRMHDARWRAFYVHLFNGLYVNAATNRLVERIWSVDTNAAPKGVKA